MARQDEAVRTTTLENAARADEAARAARPDAGADRDGGNPGETLVLWDPAPAHVGPGHPLRPRFSTAIGFATPRSGWLTFSGRITDRQADVELDQTVRIEVVA